MIKIITIVYFVINLVCLIRAQEVKSIHQSDYEYYKEHPELTEAADENHSMNPKRADLARSVSLTGIVYGFHPYWISDATAAAYYYSLLTHIAYFSADVDTSVNTTGGFITTNKWSSTPVVTYAKNNGIKVHLTITMFGKHDRVLNNETLRHNLINNIIAQMNLRGADGVNIDFEGVPKSLAQSFSIFINELGSSLKSINKELAICIPAVDWNSVFTSTFFSDNNPVVNYYFLMAYNYYYSGSSTAGPVSPLSGGSSSYHVTRSVDTYLNAGLPASKFVGGINYYGIDWPVKTSDRLAQSTGKGKSVLYSAAKSTLPGLPDSDKFFDAIYMSPWYRYQSGSQWRQVWYDDSLSLAAKYDLFNKRKLAGAGVWALGYDAAYPELWGAIKDKYTEKEISFADTKPLPSGYKLLQNYPNPFNPTTAIKFQVPENSVVTLKIVDCLGREIISLLNEEKPAGSYTVMWNGKDKKGTVMPGGIYFYCFSAGSYSEVRKMSLLK